MPARLEGGPMTILFVDSVSSVEGGAERSLLELAAALADRGHEVALATWREGALSAAFTDLGRVFVRGAAADPASPLGDATSRAPLLYPLVRAANWLRLWIRPVAGEAAWLDAVIRESGTAVAHSNCDVASPAVAAAARAAGVPWVAHVRDLSRSWFHPRIAGALATADALIAPSDFLAGRFREHGIVPEVIPNPVAGDGFRRPLPVEERSRIREELGIVDRRFAVAVVGRLDEQKGTLRVVEAARRLRDRGDDRVGFLVAGRGSEPFETRLRRAIGSAGVEDRVRLLGHRSDIPRWLPAVDALAVPSTGEGFGRVIVEGMHAGLPVVAFRDGAAPEIVEHDRTGLLVPAGDSAALADAIGDLGRDPERAHRLGQAARSAAERYEPGAVTARVERLYLRLRQQEKV